MRRRDFIAGRGGAADVGARAAGRAQPPWVGRAYAKSKPRFAVVNLNPGAGERRNGDIHLARNRLFDDLRFRSSVSAALDTATALD
jgi:hypothetical protein